MVLRVSDPPSGLAARPRRLRRTAALRALVSETSLRPERFVFPLFVRSGRGVRDPIPSLPGHAHLSADEAVREAESLLPLGIRALLLFGLPDRKDAAGSGAYDDAGVVQQAVRALRAALPDLVIITDVCLCEYTSHGHCGVVSGGAVDNDATLELLARIAVSHAAAGADIVAPSAMMDGQVGVLRRALDDAGMSQTAILGYSAKYASAFYGPFRDAAASAPGFGDRRGYQLDVSNVREAEREIALDLAEGADAVMVKPALAYLDVIARVRPAVPVPLAAYNVSGEFAMVKAAAAAGWVDERAAVFEILTAVARAGADIIITYHAKEAARWLTER
jgi:porphobilinogen synthase